MPARELFGTFCSPFCRNKVEGASMAADLSMWVDGKSGSNVFWNKTGTIGKVAGSIAFVTQPCSGFGTRGSGSVPHKALFVRWG